MNTTVLMVTEEWSRAVTRAWQVQHTNLQGTEKVFKTCIYYISGGEPMARMPEGALKALFVGTWPRPLPGLPLSPTSDSRGAERIRRSGGEADKEKSRLLPPLSTRAAC